MYKSILQFNENGIKSIEKIVKEFLSNENQTHGDLVMDLDKPLQELQRNIIKETLESIDQIYPNDAKRKETHYVERRNDPNTILTTYGEVEYYRTYFKRIRSLESEETSKYEYLTDKYAKTYICIWRDRKREYIDALYDDDYLEQIYIMGDGASWIKTGLEILGTKSVFVLDRFHLSQSITRATAHLGDSVLDVRTTIYDAISFEDKDGIKKVFNTIADYYLTLTTETKRKQVLQMKGYLLNHWESIIIRNYDKNARIGCSAEGSISYIFSDRLSRRPLGWSRTGFDKVSRLRVYVENGGSIYD